MPASASTTTTSDGLIIDFSPGCGVLGTPSKESWVFFLTAPPFKGLSSFLGVVVVIVGNNIWVLGNDFRAEYEVSLPSIDCMDAYQDKEYPARHKVIEKVQVNAEAAEGTLYNITPAANVNLCIAPGVGAELKKGTLPICILNPKQETVRIPAGTVLATTQAMTEKDIAFLDVQEDCRHTAAEPGGKTQENLGSEFDKYDWDTLRNA
ncbi:hypothetical protein Pelo_17424 [Pelomyxa schiedti]|nr:hypothetical protein Pelo_17424 [Pelomyxa schiedti]